MNWSWCSSEHVIILICFKLLGQEYNSNGNDNQGITYKPQITFLEDKWLYFPKPLLQAIWI